MQYAGKLSNVLDAMNSDAPTLGTIQRSKGRVFTESFIMGWLLYLNEMLALNKQMSESQIELCAKMVNNEYYSLKISDLTLLFKRILSGQYGKFYEGMSIDKVLTYFREYFDERIMIADEESYRKHKDTASNDEFNFSSNIQRILLKDNPSKGFNR